MALKFLNKKGWHTGSLRNIENVWKAEQKHDAEQKKLEELRKQIHEERERQEFRLLQEQAGLVPRQERLEFLYDSGLAVGKSNSEGFKALEVLPSSTSASTSASTSTAKEPTIPGALFEDKPHSANDAWRKLHSDPLLMIRQREQDALARIKNNPVRMAMIRKSVETEKQEEKAHDKKESQKKHDHSKRKHQKHSSSKQKSDRKNVDYVISERKSGHHKSKYDAHSSSDDESSKRGSLRENNRHKRLKEADHKTTGKDDAQDSFKRNHHKSDMEQNNVEGRRIPDAKRGRETSSFGDRRSSEAAASSLSRELQYKRRNVAPKLSEEERAARLREMQLNAEVHEEQRWKRLKKADEDDIRETMRSSIPGGKNFLDAAQKSVYGAEKGGSSTIEESIRRRVHYSQGRSNAHEGNAFRR